MDQGDLPHPDVTDIAEKRTERRAEDIISGISFTRYLDSSISLNRSGQNPVNVEPINKSGFEHVLQKHRESFVSGRRDPLTEGTLGVHTIDHNAGNGTEYVLVGLGQHRRIHDALDKRYFFRVSFTQEDKRNKFMQWIEENPDEALTNVLERIMQRPEQQGDQPFTNTSYFEPAEGEDPIRKLHSHPFEKNHIKQLLIKEKDTTDIRQKDYH